MNGFNSIRYYEFFEYYTKTYSSIYADALIDVSTFCKQDTSFLRTSDFNPARSGIVASIPYSIV